jgi:hypothetical protein
MGTEKKCPYVIINCNQLMMTELKLCLYKKLPIYHAEKSICKIDYIPMEKINVFSTFLHS